MKKQNDDKKTEDKQQVDEQPQEIIEEESVKKADFDKLQEDFSGLENQLKRAVADYQNLERRVAQGRSELSSWQTTNLITNILQSLDYLDAAVGGASEEEKKSGWYKGVEMAVKFLKETLKNEGLEEIVADPGAGSGTGSQFDPTIHEAVDTREGEDGKIVEIVAKGYTLNGKILRPAKVIVGKG